MNLQRFEQLRNRFEGLSFETNFTTINKILYYFSYLGNIFLILFSYFFLKTVTNAIPNLFPGQDLFFSIFIVLFMTGYELFKRFAIEQLFQNWFLRKKATATLMAGGLVCIALTAGSFYLSIKGSHRLIDDTKTLTVQNDSLMTAKLGELQTRYDADLQATQKQIDNTTALINKTVDAGTLQARPLTKAEQNNVAKWEQQVDKLKLEKSQLDSTFQANKLSIEQGDYTSDVDETAGEENSFAFFLLTIFLELLIIAGVGFNGYFNVESYGEMKSLMRTEKYVKLQNNLALLKVYFHNGTKRDGDPCPSNSKFASLVKLQGLDVRTQDVANFLNLLMELQIIQQKNKKNKIFAVTYEKALELLQDEK